MSDSLATAAAADAADVPKRIYALLNTSAGAAGESKPEQLIHDIATSFRSRGMAAEVERVEASEFERAARRALNRMKQGEVDAIVVGGGDGTISTVASVMAGSGYPVGVLPLGTLNHFARDLGLPLNLDEAVGVIAAGAIRRVDVAEANGRLFINNSSIGIYPYMVLNRERGRQAGMPKWLAMIPALLKTLQYLPLRRLSITADNRTESYRSPCVFVGNNDYQLSGSSLGTRAHLDRGRLSLFIAKSQGRVALIRLVLHSLLGSLNSAEDFQALAVSSVAISSRRKRLLVSFDGEIAFVSTPLNYTIKPGALQVFAKVA